MEQLTLDTITFTADYITLPTSAILVIHGTKAILVIHGTKAILGCGYLSIETADKLGHAVAIVSGVASFDDMLRATVSKVSKAAAICGVTIGMTGRQALLLMERK